MANVSEDVDNLINGGYLILFLAVGGVVAYLLYEVYQGGVSLGNAVTNLSCSVFGGTNCDATNSNPLSENYTEPYTAAASESIAHPIDSLETILGLNQGPTVSDPVALNNTAIDSGSGGLGV